jgi:hypothetical protein
MTEQMIIALSTLAGLTIFALTAMRCWQGWLTLKEHELERGLHRVPEMENGSPVGAARIEIADLKERLRKLEAIASGVDL